MHYWTVSSMKPFNGQFRPFNGLISHNSLFFPVEGFWDKEGTMVLPIVLEGGFGQDTCTSGSRISNAC